MRLTLPATELVSFVERQASSLFPDGAPFAMTRVVPRALEVIEHRFSRIRLRGYNDKEGPTFNHLNSDQYASFIYECSRIAFREFGDRSSAEKLFFLNKALNSIVCMYDTELPTIFLLIHTVGTVLGKATYGSGLVVCQGVTVGADRGQSPTLGEGVILFGGATIVGGIVLGDDVSVAAGTTLRNRDVPSGHVVAGLEPNLLVKRAKRSLRDHYFTSIA